jgi:hypothetical protein
MALPDVGGRRVGHVLVLLPDKLGELHAQAGLREREDMRLVNVGGFNWDGG